MEKRKPFLHLSGLIINFFFSFFMYVFMVSGLSLLMFIIHYVYTTTVRKVSNLYSINKGLHAVHDLLHTE